MMDGSLRSRRQDRRPTYEYNVDVTRKVVALAHSVGVTVEGELGVPGLAGNRRRAARKTAIGAEGMMDHSISC